MTPKMEQNPIAKKILREFFECIRARLFVGGWFLVWIMILLKIIHLQVATGQYLIEMLFSAAVVTYLYLKITGNGIYWDWDEEMKKG